jgi:hypothetical protein
VARSTAAGPRFARCAPEAIALFMALLMGATMAVVMKALISDLEG